MSTLRVNTIQNSSGDPIDLDVSSLNNGPLAGFRNQIINGDFRVNQRDGGGYNNASSTIRYENVDRWGIRDLAAGNHLAQSSNTPVGFSYSVTIDGQTNATIRHRIELYEQKPEPFVAGSQWTLSVWANNQIRARVQDSDANTSLPMDDMTATSETSNGFTRYVETFTMAADASTDYLEVALQNQNGVLMRVAGVQLEPGPVATPFEYRPIGIELALCQRYYEYAEDVEIEGYNLTGAPIKGYTTYLVQKRVTPTITPSIIAETNVPSGDANVNVNATTYGVSLKKSVSSTGTAFFNLNFTADAEL